MCHQPRSDGPELTGRKLLAAGSLGVCAVLERCIQHDHSAWPLRAARWWVSNRASILLWAGTLPVSSLECQANVSVTDSARARQRGEDIELRLQMRSIKYILRRDSAVSLSSD